VQELIALSQASKAVGGVLSKWGDDAASYTKEEYGLVLPPEAFEDPLEYRRMIGKQIQNIFEDDPYLDGGAGAGDYDSIEELEEELRRRGAID